MGEYQGNLQNSGGPNAMLVHMAPLAPLLSMRCVDGPLKSATFVPRKSIRPIARLRGNYIAALTDEI